MFPNLPDLFPKRRIISGMASIETRTGTKGTSYRVIWRTPDGQRKTKTWRDRGDAELWKSLLDELKGDDLQATNALARKASLAMTVEKVSEHRLELIRATAFTRQTYRSYMRNHIGPAFGDWPVDTVSEDDCRRFVLSLERKGLSPKYIGNVCGWLTSIFKHAVDRGWRTGNPMKAEMLPKVQRTDADEADMFLTRAEAQAIIDRMSPKYRDPALLMLATGLRPAEMRALTVGDVHLDARQPVIRVTKAIRQDREDGNYVGPPKSRASVRSVGIPASTVEMLRPHVEGRKSSEYLFPGSVEPWLSSNGLYEAFQTAAAKARADGLLDKNPSTYALRHTHASLMLDAGMDLWRLSRHMGHSSQAITDKVYAHLMPDAHYQAASYAALALGEGDADQQKRLPA